ncbi:MAG: TetR/AcrR family transcriptional regulator [Acidobacteriota bacterium]
MRGRPKSFDRDEALEKALAVFWERGFGGTAIGDLTVCMGIGRQSLYDTFGDKHSLYLEALRRYIEIRVTEARTLFEDPERGALDKLEVLLGLWKEEALSGRAGCMMVNGSTELGPTDEAAARLMEKGMARMEGLVRDLLQSARDAGELSDLASPTSFARLIMNTSHGLAARSRLGLEEHEMDDIFGLMLRLLARDPA